MYIQLSICILLFLVYLLFLILLFYLCFCSVPVILLHCGSFCHKNKFLVCVNNKAHSDSDFKISAAPAVPAMKKLLFCWMRKDADAGSVDATWRISSSSLRMCARQDCFVFERPQVVFYCNFSSSRHESKSANLIGRIVFDAARQTKETNPRRF